VTDKAQELALAWGVAIGCPHLFFTTLKNEYVSNMFGERGIVLGALHGISQVFEGAASILTGSISQIISKKGIYGLYESFSVSDQKLFLSFFETAWAPFKKMMDEFYDEVESGREIIQVVEAGKNKSAFSKMLETNAILPRHETFSMPLLAALYVAGMISQIDVLLQRGHKASEVCLESVVDAVAMLNPHMHKVGIDYTLENCSLTAGVGARQMSPRFSKMIFEKILPHIKLVSEAKGPEGFLNHPIHQMLKDFYCHV
jgi:ketol-acid reductoisomerase